MDISHECDAEQQKSMVPDAGIRMNSPFQLGSQDARNIAISEAISRLVATIEASDLPASKKQEAKDELKKITEHPLISSRISG